MEYAYAGSSAIGASKSGKPAHPFIVNELHEEYYQLGAHGILVSFDHSLFSFDLFNDCKLYRPLSLNSAVIKRQCEYFAGRYAARLALKKFNINAFDVKSASDRSPVWPTSVIGSITHTSDTAMCIVLPNTRNSYVGVDIEDWLTTSIANDICETIVADNEQVMLKTLNQPFAQLLTLVFSAKESLFKALFPFVKQFFGFDCAEIKSIDFCSNSFELMLTTTLSNELKKGMRFTGIFLPTTTNVRTQIMGSFD